MRRLREASFTSEGIFQFVNRTVFCVPTFFHVKVNRNIPTGDARPLFISVAKATVRFSYIFIGETPPVYKRTGVAFNVVQYHRKQQCRYGQIPGMFQGILSYRKLHQVRALWLFQGLRQDS